MTSLIDWSRFGKELRLKYGGDEIFTCHERGLKHQLNQEGVCTDCGWKQNPAITEALAYYYLCNASDKYWATIELLQFTYELVIRVDVGVIYHKGTPHEHRERAIKTRSYFLRDGKASYYDAAHS